ncbi:Hypothetical_protein [Hexamita inflata]|uniref:Hypothetical_protein n=1 Tax=Hexamita inflata TaxID=28002 RepID=A0AA86P0U6_9EUKA|nr:Hypothetical protein HINF_LOCUS16580 [Hexamita inflata]
MNTLQSVVIYFADLWHWLRESPFSVLQHNSIIHGLDSFQEYCCNTILLSETYVAQELCDYSILSGMSEPQIQTRFESSLYNYKETQSMMSSGICIYLQCR